jgi:hypothetical protein
VAKDIFALAQKVISAEAVASPAAKQAPARGGLKLFGAR